MVCGAAPGAGLVMVHLRRCSAFDLRDHGEEVDGWLPEKPAP